MALISCPECGKSISEKAVNCPNCGCPISLNANVNINNNDLKNLEKEQKKQTKKTKKLEKKANKIKGKRVCMFLSLLFLLTIATVCFEGIQYTNKMNLYSKAIISANNEEYDVALSLCEKADERNINYYLSEDNNLTYAKRQAYSAISGKYIKAKDYKGFIKFVGKYFNNDYGMIIKIPEIDLDIYYKEITKSEYSKIYCNKLKAMKNLFGLLPDGYKNKEKYLNAIYCLEYGYYDNCRDYLDVNLICKICSFNENFLESFLIDGEKWYSGDKCIEFYVGINGSTYFSSDFSLPSCQGDRHWYFEGNKMLYRSDIDKADIFEFEIIGKDKVKMFCCKENKTYTLN